MPAVAEVHKSTPGTPVHSAFPYEDGYSFRDHTAETSPRYTTDVSFAPTGVKRKPTRFFSSTCLPHLPCIVPCSYRASACTVVFHPYIIALYTISVCQTRSFARGLAASPHPASFRRLCSRETRALHLTMNTLASGLPLPTTGRIQDFHPLEMRTARRTVNAMRDHRR